MFIKVLRTLGFAFGGTILLLLFCFSLSIHSDTLIELWKPITLGLCIAVATEKILSKLWRKLTGWERRWLNAGSYIIVVASLVVDIFYIGNYIGATDTVDYIDVMVTDLYREQHHQVRRTGRRTYSQGPAYWVYKADISLPDGSEKSLNIKQKQHAKLTKDDTLGLAVRDGYFGVKVIYTDSIRYPEKNVKPKRKQTRIERYFERRQRNKQNND